MDDYRVRFVHGNGEPTEMELELCAECAGEFRSEDGVTVD